LFALLIDSHSYAETRVRLSSAAPAATYGSYSDSARTLALGTFAFVAPFMVRTQVVRISKWFEYIVYIEGSILVHPLRLGAEAGHSYLSAL